MLPLNLPPYKYVLKIEDGKHLIYDDIRKKYLVLTPEEWVRQHFINFLINHRAYSKGLFRLESGLKYGKRLKRSDIEVYNASGALHILVECKAPEIKLDAEVFKQTIQYNKVLNAKYIALTNGLVHYFGEVGNDGQIYFLDDIPSNR